MKKNILVNFVGNKGAGPEYSLEMARALINTNNNIYGVVSGTMENIKEWEKLKFKKLIIIEGYNNIFSLIKVFIKLYFSNTLKIKFKNVKVDFVYIPMIQPLTLFINSYFKNAKKIVTLHDPKPHAGSNPLMNFLRRKTCKSSDFLVILSEVYKKYCISKYKKKPDDIIIIPHAFFDYEKYYITPQKESLYDNKMINFLFFGRITEYKGLEVLGKAYSILEAEHENVTLTIVGSGEFKKYEKNFKGLKHLTVINKWIRDSEVKYYFEGDNIVTVLPYTEGTQSGVIPLAMKQRSLIMASDVGGIKEQIDDGVTGIIFTPNNIQELYNKMKWVVENPNNISIMTEIAGKFIDSQTWSNSVRILLESINN